MKSKTPVLDKAVRSSRNPGDRDLGWSIYYAITKEGNRELAHSLSQDLKSKGVLLNHSGYQKFMTKLVNGATKEFLEILKSEAERFQEDLDRKSKKLKETVNKQVLMDRLSKKLSQRELDRLKKLFPVGVDDDC